MQAEPKPHRGEISSLTGLRGVAAVCVMITHYAVWTAVAPDDHSGFAWAVTALLGMPIFFTLSGFVIAYSYGHWDWWERPVFNLVRLFLYRFARLYPAFLVFAIIVVIRWPEARILSNLGAHAYLLPNLLLLHTWIPLKFEGVPAAHGQFHVSWSLSTECALYLCFALGQSSPPPCRIGDSRNFPWPRSSS